MSKPDDRANYLHCNRCGEDFYATDAGWGHYYACIGKNQMVARPPLIATAVDEAQLADIRENGT